jgi:membrane protease YdiL (CAAX protease family)
MPQLVLTLWNNPASGLHSARTHAAILKQSRTLPLSFALALVTLDFLLVSLSVRLAPTGSLLATAFFGLAQYLIRLPLTIIALLWACRRFHVPPETLGIRPSTLASDFQWSFRLSAIAGSAIVAALALGLLGARLGWRAPAPPDWLVQAIGVKAGVRQFITLAALGVTILGLLAPVTEELIYRSLLLPTLTARIRLLPAILATDLVFSLLHVLPFGAVGLALPQLLGGLIMAAAFSIRWSVIPAMVIHGLANLTIGALLLAYVRLFEAFPAFFVN